MAVFAGAAVAQEDTQEDSQEGLQSATADLRDGDGADAGTATFTETAGGVEISVSATGLEAGPRGIHLHEAGVCEAPDFESAGEHFNPTDAEHGLDNPEGPHAGDLPNIEIGEDGTADYSVTNDMVTLDSGETSILDGDGTALIIHTDEDDQVSDPTGESGDRDACGVVEPVSATGAELPESGGVNLFTTFLAPLAAAGLFVAAALLLRARQN